MMSDEDLIGPALPPSFSLDESDDEEGFAGPALPPGYKPELLSSSEDDFGQEEEVDVVIKRRSKTSSRHGHGSGTTRDGHGHGSGTTRDGHGHGSGTTRDGHGHGSGTTRDGHGHGSGTTRDGHGHGSGTTRDGPTAEKRHRVDEAVSRRLTDEDDGFFGPALPPGFSKPQASPDRPAVLGPALPPGFHRPASDDEDEEDDDDGDDFPRPALPPGYTAEPSSSDEEEEDEEVIGPMPAQGAVQDSVALDIERRAQKMKDRLTGADSGPEDVVRETWMTELPPTLQHIGLGARTFKKRAGPESKDRSLWTDTPADRERKLRERLEGKETEEKEPVPQLSHKELQMAEKVSKYNETKRGESLISLHEKQMKKRKLDEGAKPVERRAFDRDQDLQVNKFDEAQKQRLLKKSQELNTRFGHSKEKMFL